MPPPLSANLRGALWILSSSVASTVMAVGVRELSSVMASMEIAFARSFVGLLIVLPVVLWRGVRHARSRRWPLHLLRGLLGVVAVNLGFYSLTHMPLATATALFFTAPLFVTLMAVPLLGEHIGWRRWAATAVGFAGTMIVFDPLGGAIDPVMLVPVGSSAIFALILIIGKKLSVTEAPLTMMLYATVIMSAGSVPPALIAWTSPDLAALLLMALVGVFATLRSYCDIRGFATGEASFVAPFQYARIIFIAAAGFLFFAEVPDTRALTGAAVIIAATLYIAHREARHPSPTIAGMVD